MPKANGGEVIVDSLRTMRFKHAFGIVSSSLAEVIDLLPEAGISYHGVRHEQWAGHMADAYARVSGTPAVVLVQMGAGLTNMVTATATAKGANSPILIISGSATSKQALRGTYQEADHVGIMKPVTKFAERVPRADRIAEFLRLAYRLAMTPPKGPVYLDVPSDFIYELSDYDQGTRGQLVPDFGCYASPEEVAQVAKFIKTCERPIILAGGACVSRIAAPLVEQLSELAGAPVVTSYGHNDAVRNDYELLLGSLGRGGSAEAMRAFSKADFVLALGTRMDDFTFIPFYGFEYTNPEAKVVQVNVSPSDIGRSRKVDLGVVADVSSFAKQLIENLREGAPLTRENYLNEIREAKISWQKQITTLRATTKLLTMDEVYVALRKIIPKHAIIALDVGSGPSLAYSMLEYAGPGTLLSPNPLGG